MWSSGENPAGLNSSGSALISILIFSKMLSGSPILSTSCSLREPHPIDTPSQNSQSQTETAQAIQVAPMSRHFSIRPEASPSRQARMNSIMFLWRSNRTNGILVGRSDPALRGS